MQPGLSAQPISRRGGDTGQYRTVDNREGEFVKAEGLPRRFTGVLLPSA